MVKIRTILGTLLFEILFILSFLYSASEITAQTIIFEDDFDAGIDFSDWEIKNFVSHEEGSNAPVSELQVLPLSGSVQITGTGTIDLTPVDGVNTGWIGRSLMLSRNISPEGELIIETDINVASAINNGYISALTIEFDPSNRIIVFIGVHDWNPNKVVGMIFDEYDNLTCVACHIPYNFAFGEYATVKLIFNYDSRLAQFYINDTLYFEDYYNGLISSTKIGFASLVRLIGTFIDSRFDNFRLSNNIPPDFLNVPDIKQYSEPWGPMEYDTATQWYPSNPSIARWGCAMTSAAMVLNYHGDNTTPELLNNWLEANNGYTRNGAVIWPAISSYSLSDSDTPALEFTYLNYSDDLLKSDIEDNQPPIIKLLNETYGGNHFIVGKGFDNSNIFINDPSSEVNSNLSQANSYWGNTLRLGRFNPSETDLSYIVLFIDDGFEFKVFSESGEIIGSEYYLNEGPMLDPENPDIDSGVEPLNAFYYPKPENGQYRVEVEGDGSYQLDSYLYNEEGEVSKDTHKGLVGDSQKDEFSILIGESSSIEQDLTVGSIIDDLSNAYYQGLISRRPIYRALKRLLSYAQRFLNIGYPNYSKRLLNYALKYVQRFTPRFIDPSASEILQTNLQTLIN